MSFIENNHIMIGGHISFSQKVFPTVQEAINYNMNSVQFFLGSPKSFVRQRLSLEDILNTRKITEEYCVNVFSHYPYTSNLVGSVSSLAWNGDKEQDTKTLKTLKELEHELDTISKLADINGVVIHPGSYKKRNDGLETISKSINKINFSENAKLLLENSAGEGSKLPNDFLELKKIFEGIDPLKKNNVGICIDTAHIHGSGIYNLSIKDEVDKMFFEFDKYLGLNNFSLLHLNDSQVELGSKKDRHECVGFGKIWKDDNTSLKYLLTKCGENNIPIILETPNIIQDMVTISSF